MNEFERAERQQRLARIRKVSAFMKWTVTGILAVILLVGATVTLRIVFPESPVIPAGDLIGFADFGRNLADIPVGQRLGLALLTAAAFLLLALAVRNVRQLFNRFQRLEFFSPRTLDNVVSFGVWLIAFAVADLISDPLRSILLTYDNPPGQRVLSITLEGKEVFLLVLGALMLLFGWILREAAQIADENRQFV